MTRPSSIPKAKAPNTVTRQNGTHCGSCFKAMPENERPKPEEREMSEAQRKLREERLAAAHLARETLERQRAARARARIPRRVGLGQTGVRI